MSTLSALKAGSKAREAEERSKQERKRNALVLILRHLADHGYVGTLERLQVHGRDFEGRSDARLCAYIRQLFLL